MLGEGSKSAATVNCAQLDVVSPQTSQNIVDIPPSQQLSYAVLHNIDEMADSSRLSESVKKFVADTVTLSLVTPGCLLDVDDPHRPPPPGEGR